MRSGKNSADFRNKDEPEVDFNYSCIPMTLIDFFS